jgi:3-deoxy-manno-octulosonate cytidylyltransferase (CMP-KDO synthetase)
LRTIFGKPLLQWVIEGVKSSKLVDEILVATDDRDIFALAETLGVKPVMTDPELPSGTDRVRSALAEAKLDPDFILNVQGDEPLIRGETLDEIIQFRRSKPEIEMLTLAKKISFQELSDINTVKVVTSSTNKALYFSRLPIPFSRIQMNSQNSYQRVHKHVGLYGYSPETLESFCSSAVSELEVYEGLEQLRALDLGISIDVKMTEAEFHGVDTLKDLEIVEKYLQKTLGSISSR